MPSIRIAAAQPIATPGDISANVVVHTGFVAAAREAAVDILIFPELSLSGYELPLLRDCLVRPDDERLSPIQDLARQAQMTVVVGAPVANGGDSIAIGAITFFPDGRISVYCKQYLHPGEEQFVTKGQTTYQCHAVRGESFALAICADISHEQHAKTAATAGASLYLAGVLVSEGGYSADSGYLCHYATAYGLGVLMANHGGPSGGYISAGRSAFWAPGGRLIVEAAGAGSLLLVAEKELDGNWTGRVFDVEI